MGVILYPPFDTEPWPTLGPQVCNFLEEYAVFGPGDLEGKPVILNEEIKAWISKFYEVEPEFVRRGKNPRAGKRRFTRCVLSLRKGSAKTEVAAWIAFVELHPDGPVRCDGFETIRGERVPVGRGVTDPYIPMVSTTQEQTELLAYGALVRIAESSSLAGDFDIGLERIIRRDGRGRAEPASAVPGGRDGARTTFMHADEALAIDTPLPTPTGWTTMGDIKLGDELLGTDGKPCQVVGKSDVHHGRPCYRVTFKDGTSVVADGGHLWYAHRKDGCNHGQGCRCALVPGRWAVRRTDEMVATVCHGRMVRPTYRYRVPKGEPLDLPAVDLPVDPYVLGLWLGDGDARNATITAGVVDVGEVEAQCQASGYRVTRCATTRAPLLYVTNHGCKVGDRSAPSLRGALRRLGLLRNKHIPAQYLRSSIQQRLALLQGLMDSDGHVGTHGDCVFINTNAKIVEGIAELARTLALVPTVRWRTDNRKSSYLPVAKVSFPADLTLPVFRLKRKLSRLHVLQHMKHKHRVIVSIEPVDSAPVQCVKVDASDSLFRAGEGMVLTHNTHHVTLPNQKLAWTVMMNNLAKRPLSDAWALETTTAPEPGGGSVAEDTMDEVRRLQTLKDPPNAKLFFFHREASDKHDLTTKAGLHAAIVEASGPYIAKWSDIEAIALNFQKDARFAERVWLNRCVQSSSKAFNVERWAELARPGYVIPQNAVVTLGFDGSRYDDATALVVTELSTGFQHLLGCWERPPTAAEWEVNVSEVDATVSDAFSRWKVVRMYCDPPKWEGWIATWAGRYGDKVVVEWWTTRRKQMAYALRAYVGAMTAGEVSHDDSPVFTRHIGNACRQDTGLVDQDDVPLWVLRKERPNSPHKIDASMAGNLSWEARMDAIAAGEGIVPVYSVQFLGGK